MVEQRPEALRAYWSESYFPALDGLRALCILLVMFNHVHEMVPGWVQGRVGVDIFFVLSGFLITTLLVRERERYGNMSLRGFYTRRFFRIVPVYAVVLALHTGVAYFAKDGARWENFKRALPYLATFMQEFRPAGLGTMFGHTWTLGIEEKFYLAWPLLVVALFPFRRRSLALTVVLGAGVLLLPARMARSYGALLLGALLGVALAKSSDGIGAGLKRLRTEYALLAAGVAYVGMMRWGWPVLVFSASIAVLVGVLVLRQSLLRLGLEQRWMVLAGRRSYGMYLIHVLVIQGVEQLATRLGLARWYWVIPAAYGLSFIVATAIYYAVERPCIELGRRLSREMRERMQSEDLVAGDVTGIRDPM